MRNILAAVFASTVIQIPLSYILFSRESLVLGQGFLDFSNEQQLLILGFVLFVALSFILFVGLPAFFLLKKLKRNSLFYLTTIGAVAPIAFLLLLELSTDTRTGFSSGENYYGTYRAMVENGLRTKWGVIKYTEELVVYSIHGFFSALVFFKIANRGVDA